MIMLRNVLMFVALAIPGFVLVKGNLLKLVVFPVVITAIMLALIRNALLRVVMVGLAITYCPV